MTTKHMIEGIMQWTQTATHYDFSVLIGVNPSTVTRMYRQGYTGMNVDTLDKMQRASGIPFDTLMEWYRLPPSATLGRLVHRIV